MNLPLGEPLAVEVLESSGLQIQHSLHCIGEIPFSKINVPGLGEWLIVVVDLQVFVFLLGGIPEKIKAKYWFHLAILPDKKATIDEVINAFVEYLILSSCKEDVYKN